MRIRSECAAFITTCILVLLASCVRPSTATSTRFDAYKILGVSRSASQAEIKKRYREMCLKYHPDKNGSKPEAERKKCETIFKLVQEANSLIGDEQSRCRYNRIGTPTPYSWSGHGRSAPASSSGYGGGADQLADEFLRAFQASMRAGGGAFGPRYGSSGTTFSTNIPTSATFANTFQRMGLGTFKSVFVQKVKVPLEDLYNGSQGVEVKVRSNLWTRNCAAIRGGAFYINLYQAFIYSLPLLRTSRTLALVVASAIFHWALPKPATTTFQLNLQPGYKGGKTKLKYASNSYDQPEVVFELQEKRHPRYQRVHNDLHTTVTISTEDAKNGCNIDIKTLDSKVIKIRINSIKDPSQGTDLRIKGKGWPIRNAKAVQTADEMDHGDLVVHIRVRRKRGWSLSHECGD